MSDFDFDFDFRHYVQSVYQKEFRTRYEMYSIWPLLVLTAWTLFMHASDLWLWGALGIQFMALYVQWHVWRGYRAITYFYDQVLK